MAGSFLDEASVDSFCSAMRDAVFRDSVLARGPRLPWRSEAIHGEQWLFAPDERRPRERAI
eukprot:8184336-Lingulodinium_polyedra.AAC.1